MGRIFFQRAVSGFRTVRGELVVRTQRKLQAEGTYTATVDGIYGDKTEQALLAYQTRLGLTPTGKIDAETWSALMSSAAPDLRQRCLQVTAEFEGTGFTKAVGDFDGAGLTWGIIGFTLRHGELEAILKEIFTRHEGLFRQAFGTLTGRMLQVLDSPLAEQMSWARSISIGSQRYKIREEWSNAFAALGSQPEVQSIQLEHTQSYWDLAFGDAERFGLRNELGLALCFDIAVQNGGIEEVEARRIRRIIETTPPTTQQDLCVIISNVVAENSNPRYVEDVRRRKLTIATTRGTVHGSRYDIKTWGLDELPR